MRFVDLIERKADGGHLSEGEIAWMVRGFTQGAIPDYQMSAMMMAILQRGMTTEETVGLTMAMVDSGERVDLSGLPGIKLDKHSTGGVGDTTTLVIAPLVAACGGTVAKMSGRGLGHTGGTLDKLESIPGCRVELSLERFHDIVRENGVSVVGQTADLVPADKKMYALRDVTATVRSIPLIASSIMSKKIASGADAIVLDVKVGSGAFMRTVGEAQTLAKSMVEIGRLVGRKVTAIITDMNQPLGMAVGNALEVREAVHFLSGMIPEADHLYQVCMLLGIQMLRMGGLAASDAEAEEKLHTALKSGEGLRRLQTMVALQGGESGYLCAERIDELCRVGRLVEVKAEYSGYIGHMKAEIIGAAAQMLGAGRARKEDVIDPAVGLEMKVRAGDKVSRGDTLCTLYVNDESELENVCMLIRAAIPILTEPRDPSPVVYGIVREMAV